MDTITFRCDKQTKDEATEVFNKYGINLSQALYMFMKQSIIQQKIPIITDEPYKKDAKSTYPDGFFELFGCLKNKDTFDESDINDLPYEKREDI